MKFINQLKNRGLKATPQRVAVIKELSKKRHPTMDEIYSSIKKNNPTMSLATVYKNINLLKENGIVIDINTPSGKMRYDYFADPHMHIICKKCGNIEDLDYDEKLFSYQNELEKTRDITIDRLDIVVSTSHCKHCK